MEFLRYGHGKIRLVFFIVLTIIPLYFLLMPATVKAGNSTATISVICNIANAIETVFPTQVTFGDLTPATDGYHTTQVRATIRSNASWKITIRCDQAGGRMREWDGSSYVTDGRSLSQPLCWKLADQPESAYKALSNEEAIVIPEAGATGTAGRIISIDLGQKASYDDLRLVSSGSSYRILISFTATQLY